MFDHGTLTVGAFPKAKSFYEAVLASLSMKSLAGDGKTYCGFGVKKPSFWIAAAETADPVSTSVQVAFVSTDKSRVDSFHQAARPWAQKTTAPRVITVSTALDIMPPSFSTWMATILRRSIVTQWPA